MSNNNNHQLGEAPLVSCSVINGFWRRFLALGTWNIRWLCGSPYVDWPLSAAFSNVAFLWQRSLLWWVRCCLECGQTMSWSAIGARIRVLSSSMSISERGWHVCLPCLLMVLRMWLYRLLRLVSCCSVLLTSPSRSAVAGWTSTYMAVGAACWTMLWLRFMPALWCLP